MKNLDENIVKKKIGLSQCLYFKNVLWSYRRNKHARLQDNDLIVTSLTYLELEEMDMLFDIFSYDKVKQVWVEKMVSHDDYYGVLNKMLAYLIFGVKNYNKFREEICGKRC